MLSKMISKVKAFLTERFQSWLKYNIIFIIFVNMKVGVNSFIKKVAVLNLRKCPAMALASLHAMLKDRAVVLYPSTLREVNYMFFDSVRKPC